MTPSLPVDGVDYLLGDADVDRRARVPYDDTICDFFAELSAMLRKNNNAAQHPDVMTFAFWCRKANIQRMKTDFCNGRRRLGRGLAFHVTPSNVPVNFAFSLAFGMLAGNANVVRLASKETDQARIIIEAVRGLFSTPEFGELARGNAFVRYPANDTVTAAFSAACDVRIVWGGDATVAAVRAHPLPARAVELTFADRYSICAMNADAVAALPDTDLGQLVRGFFNDTYLMDQNACSSPHLVLWLGVQRDTAKARFWAALKDLVASDYRLDAVHAVDKYTSALKAAIDIDGVSGIKRHGIEVYRIDLDRLPTEMSTVRGGFGTFFEYDTDDLDVLSEFVTARFQTLTYFGLNAESVAEQVIRQRLAGIDRIVPVGRALDIDVIWDGYDVGSQLSRIVDTS